MSDKIIRNKLSKQITSLSLDKNDLKKLFDILQLRATAASDIEYMKLEKENVENLAAIKSNLASCAVLSITVTGTQNEELFGTIDEVFNSVSFPEIIKSVYVNSELIYHTQYKYTPENHFELFIDFSKPKVFDFSLQPSDRTPNNSLLDVQGSDSTWVHGVFHELNAYIKNSPSKFSKVHKGSVYDLLVWLLGIPFGFWTCYKVINLKITFFDSHAFIQNIFLTYCFFFSLLILRIIFHYFRWVFPMIEYKSKKDHSIGHQITLGIIVLGLITNFIYEVIRLSFR